MSWKLVESHILSVDHSPSWPVVPTTLVWRSEGWCWGSFSSQLWSSSTVKSYDHPWPWKLWSSSTVKNYDHHRPRKIMIIVDREDFNKDSAPLLSSRQHPQYARCYRAEVGCWVSPPENGLGFVWTYSHYTWEVILDGQLPHGEEHGWLEHRPQLRYFSRPPPCRLEVEPEVFNLS